jgi:glycosyltransferase involved in cell wall biosynthesis
MYLGLPVLAYASTSIPDTMGGAGVLFHEKDYPGLAALIDILLSDNALMKRIIARQKKRANDFLEAQVQAQFNQFLQELVL